jgi:histone deacetylase complex regulatory component SIN3
MIAVIKRLLQVALYQQPHLMCAVLYLTSELIQARGKDAKLLEKVLENCNKPIFKEDKEENDLDDDFKVDIDTSDDENEIVRPISESTSSWVNTVNAFISSLVWIFFFHRKSFLRKLYAVTHK